MRKSVSRSALLLALVASAVAAQADFEAPKRKSGLWEISMQTEGMQGHTMAMKQCIDQKTDDLMRSEAQRAQGDLAKACSKRDWRRVAGGYEFESVCKFDGTTHTSKGRITGNMDSAYKMVIDTRYDPPMMGRSTARMEMDVKWTGACPSGMRPGDMQMAGPPGMPMFNVEDMKKGGARPPQNR